MRQSGSVRYATGTPNLDVPAEELFGLGEETVTQKLATVGLMGVLIAVPAGIYFGRKNKNTESLIAAIAAGVSLGLILGAK